MVRRQQSRNVRHLSPTLDPLRQMASSMASRARQSVLHTAMTRSEGTHSPNTDILIGGFNPWPRLKFSITDIGNVVRLFLNKAWTNIL